VFEITQDFIKSFKRDFSDFNSIFYFDISALFSFWTIFLLDKWNYYYRKSFQESFVVFFILLTRLSSLNLYPFLSIKIRSRMCLKSFKISLNHSRKIFQILIRYFSSILARFSLFGRFFFLTNEIIIIGKVFKNPSKSRSDLVNSETICGNESARLLKLLFPHDRGPHSSPTPDINRNLKLYDWWKKFTTVRYRDCKIKVVRTMVRCPI